jgi:hypothetical protein
VEFVVDYAAGTCRVAFYTPEAAGGGFVEAPHARMELRFVDREKLPGRDVLGQTPHAKVELYPAVQVVGAGVSCRLATA